MIKIAAISAFTPLVDNHGAPNAMVHSYLLHRPANSELYLYYYPQPKVDHHIVENDIALLKPTQSKTLNLTSMPSGVKAKLKNIKHQITKNDDGKLPPPVHQFVPEASVLDEIEMIKPDVIFMFPSWLILWAEPLRNFRMVVSSSDSSTLHCLRSLKAVSWKTDAQLLSLLHSFESAVHLEHAWAKSNALVHMVGKEDLNSYLNVNRQQAKGFYAPHPYYDFIPVKQTIDKVSGKISLLVTGDTNSIYFGNHFALFVDLLINNESLAKFYQLTFIGPGYEEDTKRLIESGYETVHHLWVEDFSKAIAQCHVQLFPLAVGTGTKGKVLHAMATGLLGIGTEYAFENIELQNNKDCVFYQEPSEIIPILEDIYHDKNLFAAVANNGAELVREKHNPVIAGNYFWKQVLNTDIAHSDAKNI